jgi:hypothetical protein
MRDIKARFEIDNKGMDKGHRYTVVVGDGFHSQLNTLANPKDKYSKEMRWGSLLGDAKMDFTWASSRSEGMYVTIARQYPNDDFDFSPEAYIRGNWLKAQIDVANFRLYNPFWGRPFLQFSNRSNRWDGEEIAFSEGDQKQFHYDIENQWSIDDNGNSYQMKIEEHGVQWTARRNDDSDDYKEFVIRLSV